MITGGSPCNTAVVITLHHVTRWKRERPTSRPLATTYRGTMTDDGDKDQALWVHELGEDEE